MPHMQTNKDIIWHHTRTTLTFVLFFAVLFTLFMETEASKAEGLPA